MDRENLLAADTVGDTAHGDGFLNATMLLGNDGALENLNSLAGTFLNLDMNTNRIADVHFGQFLLHVLAGQSLHQIHSIVLLQIKTFMPHGKCRCTAVPAVAEDRPFHRLGYFIIYACEKQALFFCRARNFSKHFSFSLLTNRFFML